ncbi:hypothetical protein [Peribacillus simplex]|uniref:hypothetical protein n=1 Tax=Peribacillus simplex TaxID=1478 RepID=UPI003D2E5F51
MKKIVAGIAVLTIGILIVSFTDVLNVGKIPELTQKEEEKFQNPMKENPESKEREKGNSVDIDTH